MIIIELRIHDLVKDQVSLCLDTDILYNELRFLLDI